MKNTKSPGLYFSVLVVMFLLAACSTTGDKSQDVQESISPDSQKPSPPVSQKPRIKKSTVYFYRPDKNVFGWTWKDIDIMEVHALGIITDPDEKSQVSHIGKLKNNSYIKKEFKPGTHRFTANWKLLPYEFTLKPDECICIKAEIGFVNALRRRATLKKIDKSSCESYINNAEEITNDQAINGHVRP